MSLCVQLASGLLFLQTQAFSLAWMHSVEKVQWQEDWRITPAGLELVAARVKGSGAGMEPGEDAVLVNGWWQWQPTVPALPVLHLASSAATGSSWQLCLDAGQTCLDLRAAEAALAASLPATESSTIGLALMPCP